MMRRLCQLKTLVLILLLVSCTSKTGIDKPYSIEATPVWFKVPDRFASKDIEGNELTHPFFDLVPFEHPDQVEINFFTLTQKESEFGYELDLVSGKRYKKYHYCNQNDIWEKYNKSIDYPPYTEGIVPRVLDQTGAPQKIIVFGDPDHLETGKKEHVYSQRVRVVGGIIRQYCEEFPCKSRDQWLSSLVLVGVTKYDHKFKKVTTLEELQKKIDWPYVKAFLENSYGVKTTGPIDEPAYRIVGAIPGKEALNYALNKGHYFQFKELNTLRSGCFNLYDYMWNSALNIRKISEQVKEEKYDLKKEAERIREIRKADFKLSLVSKSQEEIVREQESKLNIKKKMNRMDFNKWWWNFYVKYGEKFQTCIKFVQTSSIRSDADRHWFFAFIKNFFQMENLGYYYDCQKLAWLQNPFMNDNSRLYKIGKKRACTNNQLDEAFESSVTMMAGLRNSDSNHYRYIEYDFGIGGSHEKLHNWVYDNGKNIRCSGNRRTEKKGLTFPTDVSWNSFKTKSKKEDLDVIR